MAIAFDSSSSGFIALNSTGSFSHTCSGSNRYLFVETPNDASAVSYNSVSLTLLTTLVGSGGSGVVKVWGLVNPSTGANNVTITNSSMSTSIYPVSSSYTGVDPTQPEAVNLTDSSGVNVLGITNTVTTVTNNAWLVMFLNGGNNSGRTFVAGASTTLRQSPNNNPNSAILDSNGAKTPVGSYSLNADWSSSTGTIVSVIYSLKPYLTFGFTGPASGNVNSASTNFTVTPDIAVTGTVTITPSGGGLSTPIVLTFSNSSVAQTFTITPTVGGVVTLTMTNGCGLNNASPLSYTANPVVPGAPVIGTATPGNTNAVVTFSAPSTDGGATITQYTATSTPGTITGTSATSPITVTGLSNGTGYTFKVKATNSAGTGAESSASNSATPYVAATSFTFTGPSSGAVRSASTNFTVTPNAVYYGTITLTPSGAGSTGLTPVVLTWAGSSSAQTFTITPQASGAITLTPTNSNGLANPSNLVYTATAVVPLAPSIGLAQPSTGAAYVTVSPPSNDGGATVTLYTVTSSPGSKTATSPTAGTLTVLGLTNGTSYTFTAKATNSAGQSAASSASNAVIPTASSTSFTNSGPKFTIERGVGNLIQF